MPMKEQECTSPGPGEMHAAFVAVCFLCGCEATDLRTGFDVLPLPCGVAPLLIQTDLARGTTPNFS